MFLANPWLLQYTPLRRRLFSILLYLATLSKHLFLRITRVTRRRLDRHRFILITQVLPLRTLHKSDRQLFQRLHASRTVSASQYLLDRNADSDPLE